MDSLDQNRLVARVAAASRNVRRLQKHLDNAVEERDRILRESHGPSEGKLSYAELADAAKLSRGRVIQIVQPPQGEDDVDGG